MPGHFVHDTRIVLELPGMHVAVTAACLNYIDTVTGQQSHLQPVGVSLACELKHIGCSRVVHHLIVGPPQLAQHPPRVELRGAELVERLCCFLQQKAHASVTYADARRANSRSPPCTAGTAPTPC